MSAPFVVVEEDGEVKAVLFLKKQRFPFKLQLEAKSFGSNVQFRVYSGEGQEIALVNSIADLPIAVETEQTPRVQPFTPKKRLIPKEKRRQVEAVTLISTWDEQCGIATYSRFLAEALTNMGKTVRVSRYLSDANVPSLVHSQLEFGIFPKTEMVVGSNPTIQNCPKVATWHTVFREPDKIGWGKTRLLDYIEAVDREYDAHIVHNSLAKKWLMQTVSKPIHIIPHGSLLWEHAGKKEARLRLNIPLDAQVLFAFGFSADSKGFSELAQSTAKLRQSYPRLMLVVSGAVHGITQKESGEALEKVKATQNQGIVVLGKYLSEEEVNAYAEASDVLVFNYYDPDYVASASGAIHRVLNAGAPIVCSDSTRTIEFQDAIYCLKYPMGDVESLEACIETLLTEHDLAEELGKNAKLYAEATSWKRTGLQHIQVYESITKSVEVFGSDYYSEEYFVGRKGGLWYITANGKIKQWSYFNPRGEWEGAKPVMEAIKTIFNPKNLLDVGCGRGTFCAYAKNVGIDAVGIDFSKWAIENPYPRAKGLIQIGDVRDIKFPDNSFDFVFCTDIMEHIHEEDLPKVLNEVQRVSCRWIFYNIGSTMGEDSEHFVLKKGEVPPLKWQGTAVAGHVNVRPPSYWRKKLSSQEWILRDDLVEKFRELVPKQVLANWLCIIITEKAVSKAV